MVAMAGASDISATPRRVRYGVEDAHNAGYAVGEGLSVTDIDGAAVTVASHCRRRNCRGSHF